MSKTYFVLLSCIILLTCQVSQAGFTIVNGDFSDGLNGWTVDSGNVSDGGGFALFEEHPTLILSTLFQEFTLPTGVQSLSFDVTLSAVAGGVSDPFAFSDSFTASLLDPVTLDPLIANPGFSDFYFQDNTGFEDTIASVSGNHITLDLFGLGLDGLDAALYFDLIGSDDGFLTSVSIDNVQVSVIPVPGALLLGSIGVGLVGWLRRRGIMV